MTGQILRPALFALSLLAALPSPAMAQDALSTPPRTVSWYADNPKARAIVQLACIDDPGRLANTPDCVNAERASVEVALREARFQTGAMDPRDPAFWSRDPNNRRSKLIVCRLVPDTDYCDVARRSLLIEAGQARR